jgi:hypothetical protein
MLVKNMNPGENITAVMDPRKGFVNPVRTV